jgi:hypothetical protein
VPIDTQTSLSPGWWLKRELERLDAVASGYEFLDAYYRGENGIPVTADKAVRESYRRLMRIARTNFAELVVEAVRERMKPVGFRTGADGDEMGDKEAWRIWQANSLDADMSLVLRAKLAMGMAYMSVGPVDPDIEAPVIMPEDPREVITESAPGRRRKTIAALKVFNDDVYGAQRAQLHLPGVVWDAARPIADGQALNIDGWEWTDRRAYPESMSDIVAVVPIPNRADMSGNPTGEFEPHLSILDRISYSTLNRLEIATLQAYRQRGIKGVPSHDAAGGEIDYDDIFAADPGAMWLLPATAEIWESQQVDLGPLRQAIRDDVQDLAAVTRTPLFYLTPDSNNGSAEGASLAREGLIFKTGDRIVETDDPLELVMSHAFRFAGDEARARRSDMEVLWAPPERFSLAERADAASKAQDIPWRTRMRDIWQRTPQEIERMETERATDALLAPQPVPAVNPGDASL